MTLDDRVTTDPEVCHGQPCIRGTRIMVALILEWLEAGESHESILEAYPSLTEEDIRAAIRYARRIIALERTGSYVPA